jgi:hypothetical protein
VLVLVLVLVLAVGCWWLGDIGVGCWLLAVGWWFLVVGYAHLNFICPNPCSIL